MAKSQWTSRPLGERVRQMRAERRMTLKQVSAECGISVATLSKLENGQTGLNLDNIIRLAAGFGMPVSILLNEADPASGALSVARAGGYYNHDVDTMDFKVLHDDLPGQRNIFWKVRIKAHSPAEFGPLHAHPGEEFFYVLSGRMKLLLEGRDPIALRTGDSVQFDSSIGHAYVSQGKDDALILMSNTITEQHLAGYLDGAAAKPRARNPDRPAEAARTGRRRAATTRTKPRGSAES